MKLHACQYGIQLVKNVFMRWVLFIIEMQVSSVMSRLTENGGENAREHGVIFLSFAAKTNQFEHKHGYLIIKVSLG